MGDVIDFKTREKLNKDSSNDNKVIFIKRNKLFRIFFTCPNASIHMDRNETNNDISLEMWTDRSKNIVKKLGYAVVPASDEPTAIYRLNTLIAFASVDQVELV